MTRKHIHAEGPGLRPNSMGIWRNEAGYLLYEDAEIEPSTVWLHGEPTDYDKAMSDGIKWQIARMDQKRAEREAKRARVNAAKSLASNITNSVFFQFMKGWDNGEGE